MMGEIQGCGRVTPPMSSAGSANAAAAPHEPFPHQVLAKQTPNGRRCVFKHSLRGEALLPGRSMHGPRVAGRPPGGLVGHCYL